MFKLRRIGSTEDLHFWFLWVVANAVGLTVGMSVRQFLLRLSGDATNLIVVGAVLGASLGIAQFRPVNWRWVLFSAAGWSVGWSGGWALGWSLIPGAGLRIVLAVSGGLAGILAGGLQWSILRHQSAQAGWWVLVSTIGWSLGIAIGISVGGLFAWPLAGVISGGITGVVLRWVL